MPDTATIHWPTCLMLADVGGAGPRHWQSIWQNRRENVVQVDLGHRDEPIRNAWLGRIDLAVGQSRRPAFVVAHGLGALAFVWWAALLGKAAGRRVAGALLVAPPDPEQAGIDERVRRFGPLPTAMLPFPSILAASGNDPQAGLDRSRHMAAEWVSDFVEIGAVGHAGAHLGAWRDGERLLDLLIDGGPGLSRYAYRPESPLRGARRSSGAASRLEATQTDITR